MMQKDIRWSSMQSARAELAYEHTPVDNIPLKEKKPRWEARQIEVGREAWEKQGTGEQRGPGSVPCFVSRSTPREVVDKLHQETLKALHSPGVPEKLAQQGVDPMPITPSAFDAQIKRETDAVLALTKAGNLKFNWPASKPRC